MRCAALTLTFFILTSHLPGSTASASPFDRVVPSDTLLYWGNEGYTDPVLQFSNYQQAIQNWHSLLNDVLEIRVLSDELNAIAAKSGVAQGFAALQGDQWCFALCPLLEGTAIPGIGMYVAEVKDATAADRVLSTLFEDLAALIPGLRTVKDEYYGYWLRTLYGPMMLPGLDLTYAFKDSLLMIANSKSLLLRTIDQLEDGKGFLAEVKTYQEAIAQLPPARKTTFFLNSAAIGSANTQLLDNLKALQQLKVSPDLNDAMPLINAVIGFFNLFQSYASSWSADAEGRVTTVSYTRLNLAVEDAGLRAIFERKPIPFPFEKYLPRKVGTVSSGNILGPRDLWTIANKYLTIFPKVKDFLGETQGWEKETGFSAQNDLLPWLGDSWCLLRPVMDLETIVASNQLALFLEITDTKAAENGIQKLMNLIPSGARIPLVIQNETYRNAALHSLTLPIPLIPVAPSWCIDGHTLIITTKPEIIREMLDIAAGAQTGIDRNRQYSLLRDAALAPANKLTFQDNESEFYAYREAMRKVSSFPEFGYDLPPELQILPKFILDRAAYWMNCWQVLRGTVKRTVVEKDRIITHKVRLYGDLRAIPPLESVNRYKLSLGAKDLIALWADYLQKKGDVDRALRLYSTLVEFFPQDGYFISRLGDVYKSQGNMQEALDVYNRLVQQNPKTAYLISRESLYDNADADAIAERVRTTALTTSQIDENAALFGIALAKRNAGDLQTARTLDQKVAQSASATSSMKLAASRESELLNGQVPSDTLVIPEVSQSPQIDGSLDEEMWSRAAQAGLGAGIPANQAQIRLLRDLANLYIGLQVQDTAPSAKVLLRFCPDRNYVHFVELSLGKETNNPQVTIRHQKNDPYGLSLERDMPLFADWPSFSGARDIHTILQNIFKGIGDADSFQFEKLFTPKQPVQFQWNNETSTECIEMAIPWEILRSQPSQPIWLFNLIRTLPGKQGEQQQSLSGPANPDDCFADRWIRVQ